MNSTAAGQCRYHSDQSTRWYCRDCDLPLCTTCKPYADQLPQDVPCPLCQQPMDDIAVGDPFWRNPEPLLAYPLDRNCLIMMAVLATFVAALASGRFSLLAIAVATVILIRGCFVVIERSSLGRAGLPSDHRHRSSHGRRLWRAGRRLRTARTRNHNRTVVAGLCSAWLASGRSGHAGLVLSGSAYRTPDRALPPPVSPPT